METLIIISTNHVIHLSQSWLTQAYFMFSLALLFLIYFCFFFQSKIVLFCRPNLNPNIQDVKRFYKDSVCHSLTQQKLVSFHIYTWKIELNLIQFYFYFTHNLAKYFDQFLVCTLVWSAEVLLFLSVCLVMGYDLNISRRDNKDYFSLNY